MEKKIKVGDKVIYKNRIDNKTQYEVCSITLDGELAGVCRIGGTNVYPVKIKNLKFPK